METLRILIVDDEPGMRLAVTRALGSHCIRMADLDTDLTLQVEQAASGEEAMEKIAGSLPDLVLLDHKLPGLSGLEVLARMTEHEPDLLMVMITAYASLETAVTATKQGAFDFLAKPFTPAELKAVVGKAARHLILQRQARKLAEEKRQLRFQFLSTLVHELKTPLAAIQGYLYVMRDRTVGNDISAYASVIQRTLARVEGMRKLIIDLLDLTRIESGQKTREFTRVDLVEAARLAIETATPDATAAGISLHLQADEPVLLWADRGEIDIILNNLVSNAVKYNRDNGRVEVRVRAEQERVLLEVADTGIGMSEQEMARLFHEFVRIKSDKTRNITGSGLGLSIMKKLALLNGGDVTVHSRPDMGTTFCVSMKRRQC